MGLPPGTVVARQWRVQQLIGRGTFSEIYEATRITDDRFSHASDIGGDGTGRLPRVAAVKIGTGGDMGTLKREANCLSEMGRTGCSATFFGQDTTLKALVMRRMGENLSAVKRRCARGHTFCVRDAVVTALHILRCLRAVHRVGYVHRDVKLSNFVLGPPSSAQDGARVFVIDFGLSRRVLVADGPRATLQHVPERPVAEFRGTSMYASAGAHASKDLGRVDDLWSFLFVVVDLLCGRLPWREAVKAGDKNAVAKLKRRCFEDPHLLFAAPEGKIAVGDQTTASRGSTILVPLVSLAEAHLYAHAQDTVFSIAMHLKGLRFADAPSYQRIRDELESLLRLCLPGNSNRAIADNQLLLPANIVHRAVPKPRVAVGVAQSPTTTRSSAADPVSTSGLMTSAAGAAPPPRLQRPAKLSFATPTREFKSPVPVPAYLEVSTPVEGGFTPAADAGQQGTRRNDADDSHANQDLRIVESRQEDKSEGNGSNASSPGNGDEPAAKWNKYWDSNYETWYWHNEETCVSQWTDPFAEAADAARASAGLAQSDRLQSGAPGQKAVLLDQRVTLDGAKRKLASISDPQTSQKRTRGSLDIVAGTSIHSEKAARSVPKSEPVADSPIGSGTASLGGTTQGHQGWLARTGALLDRAAKGEALDTGIMHGLYLEALQNDSRSAGKAWSGSQSRDDSQAMQLLLDTQLMLRRLETFLFRRKGVYGKQ
eukprot:INCI13108.1.p1 GENE.INCI13108.1~~INCI13108.1.p1  ORF type:complete len:712 (+),score=96.50 INCI13108.1:282-2417(+)